MTARLFKKFKVNLHILHCFLLLSNLVCFLLLKKTLYCIRLFLKKKNKAGSGSAFRKTAGSGSAKNEWGSIALVVARVSGLCFFERTTQ